MVRPPVAGAHIEVGKQPTRNVNLCCESLFKAISVAYAIYANHLLTVASVAITRRDTDAWPLAVELRGAEAASAAREILRWAQSDQGPDNSQGTGDR